MSQSHFHFLRGITLTLFCCAIIGCSAKQPPPPPLAPTPPPPPRPMWSGEKAQIAVVSFDDKVSSTPSTKGKKRNRQVRNLLGRGMENQLLTTLRQAGQFMVMDPPERTVRNKRGKTNAVRIDTIEGAEFLLSGAITKYLPSQDSLSAGVERDPLLGAFSSDTNATTVEAAGATFAAFTPTPEDRVEISLHLIDAKSGRLVSETTIEAVAQDLGSSLEGLFGPELLNLSGELSTPLQKAVRATNIKAVNWIADNCLAYRKQLAENPPPEPPQPLKKKARKKTN
jgi:curli biogenesis system outer membrane secretion channel CsgG